MSDIARYIDADWIYEKVENRYRMSSGIEHRCERDLLDLICEAPTADVVSKSEVEELTRENESFAKTVNEASELIRKQRTKIEKVKAEVAREIFEEIEDVLLNNHCLDEWSDYPTPHYYEELKDDLAELKKKYTEGT